MTTYTIYVMWCKTDVTKLYIDYTTNLNQLIKYHKEHSKHTYPHMFNIKLYRLIEQSGGFDNWSIQAHSICTHRDDAEQKCYDLLDELRTKMNLVARPISKSTADQLLYHDKRSLAKCSCGLRITRNYLVEHTTTRKHRVQLGMHMLLQGNPARPPV